MAQHRAARSSRAFGCSAFASGGTATHVIYALQHASGWKYGDTFAFVDVLDSQESGSRISMPTAKRMRPEPGEDGGEVDAWILVQPQLRWHLNERVATGVEYQFWANKLGDGSTDENAVQALLVWEL